MKILFRTDASAQIGTGHVMRCCTLAEALLESGAQIRFVSRHLPSSLEKMLREKGFELSLLGDEEPDGELDAYSVPHAHWLGASQMADAKATLRVIDGDKQDWVVVDHYALDASWERQLRQGAKNIMVIDDLADRKHDCDLLLDQNFYHDQESRYLNLVPKTCQMLLGPGYALLRKEFAKQRVNARVRTGEVKQALVFFGGVDLHDYTTQTILALSELENTNFAVDVVIGAEHANRAGISDLCKKFGYQLHVQSTKMAELMSMADLAIGAGGGAVWERACMMLPTLSIPIAENQVMQLADLAKAGILYTFDTEKFTREAIKRHGFALIENHSLRYLLSSNSALLVDGRGAEKVAKRLSLVSSIAIREATLSDENDLFLWRNHPSIRNISFNKNEISSEQHANWFKGILASESNLLLIGEYEGRSVGVVRFDVVDTVAEVSIYLIQKSENKGMGLSLLQSAELWLKKNKKHIRAIKASVIESNDISHRFFIRAGFQPVSRSYRKEL